MTLMSGNERSTVGKIPRMIFCRVNPLRGISGGDVYDGRLCRLASGYEDIKCEEFILLRDNKTGSPAAADKTAAAASRIRHLFNKISAPVLLPFRLLSVASGRCGRSEERVWFFNSSKVMWFLSSAAVLRISGKKAAAVTHHPLFLQFSGIKRVVYKIAELVFLRLMNRVIVPSPYTEALLSKYLKEDKLILLPIPFDTADMKNDTADQNETGQRKKERDPESGKCTIVSIATIEPRKGQADIPAVMLELRKRGIESVAVLVGKTVFEEYAAEIRRKASRYSLDVKFTGYIGAAEKRRIMSEATVYVSTSGAEGYGMSVVEAMIAGVPVVAYRNTSMPMLLGEGRGVLCADGDPAALAEGVASVLPGCARRAECVSAAGKFAMSLATEKEFDRLWHKIIKEI